MSGASSLPVVVLASLVLFVGGAVALESWKNPDVCSLGEWFPDKDSISPEVIFITNQQSKGEFVSAKSDESGVGTKRCALEVAKEFRFHMENVTLAELELNGFSRSAPVTFLMHGFTSGYPLQAWISAIVEAYTIDRATSAPDDKRVHHNLFIINWEYAARGWNYAKAVTNIPKVATYATKFIDERLLSEAAISPRRIQLIGHSLGAHLAGSIGKRTRSKLGRIYGLDPAGPCFGSVSDSLVDLSHRLAPGDALEVVTIHTNTAKLGLDKTLGRYSVFVEGGATQPGCDDTSKFADFMSVIRTTVMGKSDDTPSCSHGRAPNLFAHRIDQSDRHHDCQLMAYECKDWDAYTKGQCGICHAHGKRNAQPESGAHRADTNVTVVPSVDCLLVGLDWQYPELRAAALEAEPSAEEADNKEAAPVEGKRLFLRTSNTQPYCTNNYQVVLELNEPFVESAPSMSMVLQDSVFNSKGQTMVPNSININAFGNKYSDLVYTQLVSSTKKLRRIYHATLLIPKGLKDGQRLLKNLHINYMSHEDPQVRQKLSSRLCLLKTNMDRHATDEAHQRYFFELCDDQLTRDEANNCKL